MFFLTVNLSTVRFKHFLSSLKLIKIRLPFFDRYCFGTLKLFDLHHNGERYHTMETGEVC